MKQACKIICILGNDYISEMVICMGAWLDGYMRNDSKRFSKCIYTARSGFITYNPVESQAGIQSCIHT